jgi:hypothetical protein
VGLAAANEPGNVQAIGALLFGPYVWPFEVTSILLVIAAIGAMVLGRKTERPEDLVDRVENEPLGGGEDAVEDPEPAGEPVGAYRAEEA